MTIPPRPELIINYAPELDLRFTFAELLSYGGAASPDYRFEMDCCFRHPRSTLRYNTSRIYFAPKAITGFQEQLGAMRQGLASEAALSDPGELVVFRLEGNSRKTVATLDVREYLPPSVATLHESIEVDYDLFVNKLHREVERFVEELSHIDASRPE
jgi:hypothetical protein